MKKLLLLPLALSSLFANALIKDSFSVTKEITPDMMKKSITLQTLQDSSTDVIKTYEDILKNAQNYKNICKNNNYSVSPRYSYDKGKTTFTGYEGSMTFSCSFDDIKKFEPFFNQVIKPLPDTIKTRISNTAWVISKKLEEQTIQELKIASLNKTAEIADTYEKHTEFHRCNVTSVNLDQNTPVPYPAAMSFRSMDKAAVGENIELSAPQRENQPITVNTQMELECR